MTRTFSRAMRVFTEDGSEEAVAKLASLVIRAPPILPRPMHDPAIPTEVTIAAYRRAVDHRHVSVLRCVASEHKQIGAVLLEGRHVGTLGTVVATGRSFSCLAHVCVEGDEVVIESNLLASLIGIEPHVLPADASGFRTIRAATRSDLLEGDPEATYWARAWNLSPYLARVAVLLIAGCSVSTIAHILGVTSKTARTYIERVLRNAGLGSVAALPLAALERGREPPDHDSPRTKRSFKASTPEREDVSPRYREVWPMSRSPVHSAPGMTMDAPREGEA